MASSAPDGFGAGPNFLADMISPQAIYVTPDVEGVQLWCGYCCKPILSGPTAASLSTLMHYADDHRLNICPSPCGPFVATWAPPKVPLTIRGWPTLAEEMAYRRDTVEQFTAALLTGLDDLPRHNGDGTCIGAGDVADLVHKVALEVTG